MANHFKKTNISWFASIAAVIILTGLLYAGFVLSREDQGTATPSPAPTEQHIKYTNEEYGFSLLYPNDWKVEEKTASQFEKLNTQLIFSVTFTSFDEQLVISINIFNNPDRLGLGQWIERYNPNPNDYEDTILGSFPARRYEKTAIGQDATNIFASVSSYVYVAASSPNNNELDLLLRSFKFTK